MFDIDYALNNLRIKDVQPPENIVAETKLKARSAMNKKLAGKAGTSRGKTGFPTRFTIKIPAAAALILALILIPLLLVTTTAGPAVQAFYTVDINPSVELQVDSSDKVMRAEPKNSDAAALMKDMDCIGLGIDESIQKIVSRAKEMGYMAADGESYVLVARFGQGQGAEMRQQLAKTVSDAAGEDTEVMFLAGSMEDRRQAEKEGRPAGVALLEKEARAAGIDPGLYPEGKGRIGGLIRELEEREYPAPKVSGKVSDGHAVLSWERIDARALTGYKVVASEENPAPKYPDDGEVADIKDSKADGFTVKEGLKPGKAYYFSVTAVYEGGMLAAGNAVKLTIPEEPKPEPSKTQPPPPVEPPKAYPGSRIRGRVSGEKIRLNWEKITSDEFEGYRIVASASVAKPKYPENKSIRYIKDRGKTSLTFSKGYKGLKAGRRYYFSVTVVYKGGRYVPGNAVRLRIPVPKPKPKPPPKPEEPEEQGMKATTISGKISGGKVVLSWKKINNEQFQGYKVVMSKTNPHPKYPGDTCLSYIQNAGSTHASYNLDCFEKGKKYYFSITVLYKDGTRKAGNAVALTIPDGSEPEEPMKASHISGSIDESGKIHLKWQKISHPKFSGYKLVYSKSPNPSYPSDPYIDYITDPGRTSKTLDSGCFEAGKTYYFSITVLYDGGRVKKAGNDVAIKMPECKPC
jgi:hypothetical protein